MYLCFVDYQKAFDKVNWSYFWTIMEEMGTPKHLVQLVRILYQKNRAKVRIDRIYSESFKMTRRNT